MTKKLKLKLMLQKFMISSSTQALKTDIGICLLVLMLLSVEMNHQGSLAAELTRMLNKVSNSHVFANDQ
jgi:hypothetical protein